MFYEKRIGSVPFFRFSELEEISGLVHAFTSKQTDQACGLESVERQAVDKTPFLDLLGLSPARTIQLLQIHSNHVLRRASPDINHPEGDGLVLTRPGLFGVIKTADCLPGSGHRSTSPATGGGSCRLARNSGADPGTGDWRVDRDGQRSSRPDGGPGSLHPKLLL